MDKSKLSAIFIENTYEWVAAMTSLNFNHLQYFWMVAREGGVTAASEKLLISQPTVSSQIRKLERAFGAKLFERAGRGLRLTQEGQVVFDYADEIFSLGRELAETFQSGQPHRAMKFRVGVSDVWPKLIAYRVLRPVTTMADEIQLECREGKLEDLLADLSVHRLDLVLSDAPMPASSRVRAFNHPLGESTVSFLGVESLAEDRREGFPRSLNAAPLLLPTQNTVLRRSIDQFFDAEGIRPRIVGEFEDSALMKTFGQAGLGLFPAPSAIVNQVREQYSVELAGEIASLREQFYAISPERRIKHPAAIKIAEHSRRSVFSAEE